MRYLVLLLLGLALLAACAGEGRQGREIAITIGEYFFRPERVTVAAGERVTFVVRNEGRLDHEFESDEAGIEEVLIPPGKTRRVNWQAPDKPGSFPVYCDLPGHREKGMEMILEVKE